MSENNTNDKKLFLLKELSGDHSEIDFFEEIFYQFPDVIQSVDQEGKIVAFNRRATELLGYEQEELIGKSIFEIYAPEVRDALKKGFKELQKVGSKEAVQSKVVTKTGEVIDVEVRSLSLYDAKGGFVKTLSILRDMRELNYLRNSLVQQSKLAAIGELAAGIMHDIRNPLTVITTYNEFIQSSLQNGKYEKVGTASERIGKGAKKIERLSNHLREFTRSEEENPQPFLLNELIDECLLMVESRILKAGVRLINEIKDKQVKIIGRPNVLEQVFINLIANACDACAEQEKKGEVTLSVEKQQDRIIVAVKDNGPGIKEENIKTIFEAFFTTKEKGKGTGLGLSICKGIVNDQGGIITVTSDYGHGAHFQVMLPENCEEPLESDSSQA